MAIAAKTRDEWALEIGGRVRAARLAAELSQEKLAARAGLTRETVRRTEEGISFPTLETVAALAKELDLAPEALVGWPMGLFLNVLANSAA